MSRRRKSNMPVLLLILGVVMVIVGVKQQLVPAPPHKYSPSRVDAYVMGQQFVKKHLEFSASAEFPTVGDSHTVITGTGDFLTHSYVDTHNRFGATIRTKYYCELEYHPDSKEWQLHALVFPELNQVFIPNSRPEEFNESTPPPISTPAAHTQVATITTSTPPQNNDDFFSKDYPWELRVMAKYMFTDPADDYRALMIYRRHYYNSDVLSAERRDKVVIEILDKWSSDDPRHQGRFWYNITAENVDDLHGQVQDFTGWICSADLGHDPIYRLIQ